MPLFSIVVPVYNAEKYLSCCIDSVLAQSLDDYEMIIVDDGSTDASLSIARKYEQIACSRIKVLSQNNKGPFGARQKAYRYINGKYVLHLDSDDELRPDALEVIATEANAFNADVIAFEYSKTADYSNTDKRFPYTSSTRLEEQDIEELIRLAIDTYAFNSMCSKAVKSEIITSIEYPERMKGLLFAEDYLQSMLILDKIKSFSYINQALYYYRPNENSITRTVNRKYIEDAHYIDGIMKTLIEKWSLECKADVDISRFRIRSLRTFYNYFDIAFKNLPKEEAIAEVKNIANDEWFRACYELHGARSGQRVDRRLCLWAAQSGHYELARFLFRATRKAKNMLRTG